MKCSPITNDCGIGHVCVGDESVVGAPPEESAEEGQDPDHVERVPPGVRGPDAKFPQKAENEKKV
jgi:hypothetical protein